jgi:hypothetical protein
MRPKWLCSVPFSAAAAAAAETATPERPARPRPEHDSAAVSAVSKGAAGESFACGGGASISPRLIAILLNGVFGARVSQIDGWRGPALICGGAVCVRAFSSPDYFGDGQLCASLNWPAEARGRVSFGTPSRRHTVWRTRALPLGGVSVARKCRRQLGGPVFNQIAGEHSAGRQALDKKSALGCRRAAAASGLMEGGRREPSLPHRRGCAFCDDSCFSPRFVHFSKISHS